MNGKEQEVDRRRGGKIVLKMVRDGPCQHKWVQLKTGQDEQGLFRSHMWCHNDLARLWNRLEYTLPKGQIQKEQILSIKNNPSSIRDREPDQENLS